MGRHIYIGVDIFHRLSHDSFHRYTTVRRAPCHVRSRHTDPFHIDNSLVLRIRHHIHPSRRNYHTLNIFDGRAMHISKWALPHRLAFRAPILTWSRPFDEYPSFSFFRCSPRHWFLFVVSSSKCGSPCLWIVLPNIVSIYINTHVLFSLKYFHTNPYK